MEKTASKLDWLKERKDFKTDPVARAATRVLEDLYAPHGDPLYPWILREIKRNNISLPRPYEQSGGWMELVKQEMAAERELARRQKMADEGELSYVNGTIPEAWGDDEKPIDWDDIENGSWNRLTDFINWWHQDQSAEGNGWNLLHNALKQGGGDSSLNVLKAPPQEHMFGKNREALTPHQLRDWEKVLTDRAKRRKGVDPMQYSAPEFLERMNHKWLPEYDAQTRQSLGDIVHTFPDKWTIRRLRDAQEAEQEGEDMGHCVGGYGDWIENGKSHIFSLRDPRNRPHTTLEIQPPTTPPATEPWHGGKLTQVYGKEDSAPIEPYKNRIREWFGSLPPEAQPNGEYHPDYLQPQPHVGHNLHYPGTTHTNQSGALCHCPWGAERVWSWEQDPVEYADGLPPRSVRERSGRAGLPARSRRGVGGVRDLPTAPSRARDAGDCRANSGDPGEVDGPGRAGAAPHDRGGSPDRGRDRSLDGHRHAAGEYPFESFQQLVDAYQDFLTVAYDETPEAVDIYDIQAFDKGEGVGSRFMQQAAEYCRQHDKQLIVSEVTNDAFFARFPFLNREAPQPGSRPRYLSMTQKMAAKTRTQKLQEKERFEREFGPDRSPVDYRFPDGWTINRLETPHATAYEGELQPNCLGSAKSLRDHIKPELWHDPSEYTPMASLRDPDNLPHASFSHPSSDLVDPDDFGSLDVEGGHGSSAQKYMPYLHHWWTNVLGRPPLDEEGWDWHDADPMELGDPKHEEMPPHSFQEYKPGGFWDRYGPMKGQLEPWAEQLRRASRPMKQAFERITKGEDYTTVVNELRQGLLHNHRPDMVDKFIEDLDHELKRWKDYQPYGEEEMKPPARTEFPEFYWMHGQYGPEAMNAVQDANDVYRAYHWNHPSLGMNVLDQNLQGLDLMPDQVEGIRNAFWDAHARAYAQRSGQQYDPSNSTFSVPLSPEERMAQEIETLLHQYQTMGVQLTPENIEAIRQQVMTRFGITSKVQTCPTCGDPLQGEHGTFCPRCQWSEMNVNIDHDPLSNPPDPTVDMHRGIQASRVIPSHRWDGKWLAAVEDF